MTLLECMVVVAVTAIVIAIASPVLASANVRSRQAVCVANMRSSGVALFSYSVDYRDGLPFGGYEYRPADVPGFEGYRIGGVMGLAYGAWAFLFPEHWRGDRWSRGMTCPLQPTYDRSVSDIYDWRSWPTPQYSMTFAVWTDASHFGTTPAVRRGREVRSHHAADVVFPASKGYVIESPGFCVDGPRAREDIFENRQTYVQPVSILFFDGAVIRRAMKDLRQCKYLPVLSTYDGIRGRDL